MLKPYEYVDAKEGRQWNTTLDFRSRFGRFSSNLYNEWSARSGFPTTGNNVAGEFCDLVIQTSTS